MKKLFTLAIGSFLVINSFGQIAAWNTFSLAGGSADYGPSPYAAITLDANLTSSGLVRGTGLTTTGTGAGKVWGANGFATTTVQNAIDSSKFITFTLSPKANYNMSLTYIDSIRIRISSTGPISLLAQYAIGAGAYKNLRTYSVTRPGSTTNFALDTIKLSNVTELQNVSAGTTVTFRLIPYTATSATGTFYIGNNATSYNSIAVFGSAVLPVTLKAFTASLVNNQPSLTWVTSNETNFNYFGVEKSLDAKNFVEIGKVTSKKTANGSLYNYNEVSKAISQQYYRLKLVDNDGSFKYSNMVTLSGKEALSVTAYPNPVTDVILLSHPKASKGAFIQLTGIDGRNITNIAVATGATQTSMSISKFVKGSYIAVYQNAGVKQSTQFIKQ